jgi:hypothetical protein
MSPNAVRLIAQCAPGRRVTVISARGERYELPLKPPAAVVVSDPIEELSKQLMQRDAEQRAAMAQVVSEVVSRVDVTVGEVKAAVSVLAQTQERAAHSASELARTMAMPVRPIYDANGKLIGAHRVGARQED